MLDSAQYGPGFPEWTELGQETGLDPLGMQRPIELAYQSLLPGISTITLRLRYYSFFAWLLETYAKGKRVTTDYDDFRRFQRRAEALYALVCARGSTELGVAGIDWAYREMAAIDSQNLNAVIDFKIGADPDADQNLRYLRNKGGAFGGIYASQMREMGLVKLDDTDVPIPFCKDPALKLVDGFQNAIDVMTDTFLATVDSAQVSLETLDRMAAIKPSNILARSAEQDGLASVLMGRHEAAADTDRTRRQTMLMLLQLAETLNRPPKSEETKWAWFGAPDNKERTLSGSDLRQVWALYQASDLFRLSYEVLLYAALRIVQEAPSGRLPLQTVIARVMDLGDLPDAVRADGWMQRQMEDNEPEEVAKAAKQKMFDARSTGDPAGEVQAALALISALTLIAQQIDSTVVRWLGSAGHFQSLVSESDYLRARAHLPVTTVIAELLQDRILKRHLWVASRKFRNQKAYTFLLEPDEGALRFRSFFQVSPSSPRIDQAVQFLRDVKFLDDGGLTDLGREELQQA